MATLTAANATIYLTIPGVFGAPQQLQGFAADDVFSTDQLASSETLMGVDGVLSGGFVYVEVKQNYSLQADSASIAIFDQWFYAQQAAADTFTANGLATLRSVGKKWTMTKGFLTGYAPIPDTKKLLQPQKFAITWQRLQAANV